MRIATILLAAAAVAAPLAPASAEPVTVRIGYGDLDLRDPAAVQQLRKRTVRAIERACRSASELSWQLAADKTCETSAIAMADREIERHRQRIAVAGL